MRTYRTITHPALNAESKTRRSAPWLRYGLLAGLVIALSSSVALADETGWYVGVKAGQADVEAQLGDSFVQFVDSEETALAAGIGYRFHRNFAVEAWYQDFGTFESFGPPCADTSEVCAAVVAPTASELEGVKVRALGYWPVNERFSVYGMVGALDWQTDVRTNFLEPILDDVLIDRFDGTDFLYGAGFESQYFRSLRGLCRIRGGGLRHGGSECGVEGPILKSVWMDGFGWRDSRGVRFIA